MGDHIRQNPHLRTSIVKSENFIETPSMHTLANHPLDEATTLTVHAFLKRVAAVFPVRSAILFGSRARGDFQPDSDADMAILLLGHRGQFIATKLAMADIAFDVMLDTGILVKALPVWEHEWETPGEYRNPYLLRNIEREGIIINDPDITKA